MAKKKVVKLKNKGLDKSIANIIAGQDKNIFGLDYFFVLILMGAFIVVIFGAAILGIKIF